MKANKCRRALGLLLCLLTLLGALPSAALAAEETYVLMNIPYAQFYAAQLGEAGAPDAVSAATKSKRSNGGLAAGSYHVGTTGDGVDGVIYPVMVPDRRVLDAALEITDASSVEVTTTARGQTSTTTYTGKDALFEAPDYAWYALAKQPAQYTTLSVAADGSFRFSAISGSATAVEGVSATVTYNGRHTSIELVLEGTEGIAQGDAVSAVVLTTGDGAQYGMGHVTNIWRATQLGWNLDEPLAAINGKTITNIRYYTQDAILDFPVQIAIADVGTTGYYDVPKDADYTEALIWARKNRVTSGTGNGTFSPDLTVNRATLVTFLWKRAGQPQPTSSESPFTDIREGDWYYKAVLWALENGITDGTGADCFSPALTVDRAQILGFLWKAEGKPAPSAQKDYDDVKSDAWYRDAASWAAEKGLIETGTSFRAELPYTRAEIVSLLYATAQSNTQS
ncbi:MAG: S-layer homology domain-containing protein [Oscillospiraceae bacterium]|nr:S-layer homology domain-containing protein [Oscillospiraceae bacterium]